MLPAGLVVHYKKVVPSRTRVGISRVRRGQLLIPNLFVVIRQG